MSAAGAGTNRAHVPRRVLATRQVILDKQIGDGQHRSSEPDCGVFRVGGRGDDPPACGDVC